MISLKSIWHDLFGHTTGLRHSDGCDFCMSSRSIAFCTDCQNHYRINEPPIRDIRI